MTTFSQWVESGTFKRGTVDLFGDAALLTELEAAANRIEAAKKDEADARENGEWTASRKSVVPALEAEAEALLAKYDESKMVVHLRALTTDERDAVVDEVPSENPPMRPDRNSPMAIKAAWEKARDEWQRKDAKAEAERRLRLLAIAIEKVVVGGKDADAPSIDDLRALRSAPYGNERINQMWAKVSDLSKMGEAPDPFSRRESETTPD